VPCPVVVASKEWYQQRVRFVRPSNASAVEQLLGSLSRMEPTYAQTGATLAGELPGGFHHDRYRGSLGLGEARFHRAVKGLRSWQAHRATWIRVVPDDSEIRTGATVVVMLGPSWLAIAAPCRVVAVIDEPSSWGFAYGSLPGHPEQGEQAFVTSIAEDGTVTFEITAFSRPGGALLRLAGPLGRALQRGSSRRYFLALQRFVDGSDSDSV
jgi:uncharacterized protein (UPF0548 family)